jgi:hypothetical protein
VVHHASRAVRLPLASHRHKTLVLVTVVWGTTYKFNWPEAVTGVGDHLLVARSGGSVTELGTSTGALVRVLSAPGYRRTLRVQVGLRSRGGG